MGIDDMQRAETKSRKTNGESRMREIRPSGSTGVGEKRSLALCLSTRDLLPTLHGTLLIKKIVGILKKDVVTKY